MPSLRRIPPPPLLEVPARARPVRKTRTPFPSPPKVVNLPGRFDPFEQDDYSDDADEIGGEPVSPWMKIMTEEKT